MAMHCNLRPPNPHVAPVVLGFNYEARNAPAYTFNSTTSADPQCAHITFKPSRTIRDGVIDDSTHFPDHFFRRDDVLFLTVE